MVDCVFMFLKDLGLNFVNFFLGIKFFEVELKFYDHDNKKNTSYSFVLKHNDIKFGTHSKRLSLNVPCKFHLN